VSAARAKGTAAETAVVRFLAAHGARYAERRALRGVADLGDVAGIPGVVIEVRNRRELLLPTWAREAEAKAATVSPPALGVTWAKTRGSTDPGRWVVAMTGATFARLLTEAGYLDQPGQPDAAEGAAG
jgi:hypothetical protein